MIHRWTLLLASLMPMAACAGLLGIRANSSASHPFEHRAHVLAGVSCVTCHRGMAQGADTDPLHLPGARQCISCHAKPHDSRECSDCHGELSTRAGAQYARERLRFEHGVHTRVTHGDCVRCHQDVVRDRPVTLRPSMATCFGCHEHRDQWTLRDCQGCHVDLGEEHVTPEDHLIHQGDFLREHGVRAASAPDLCTSCHSQRSCASCHGVTTAGLPARLRFDDPQLSGLHRAGFRARHAEESRAAPGLCTTCHSEASCAECHARAHVAPGMVDGTSVRSPHPTGWLSPSRGGGNHGVQARMDPAACASCHGGAGEQLCVGCHRVGGAGGNPHPRGFSSTKDRSHDLPCRLCHSGGG